MVAVIILTPEEEEFVNTVYEHATKIKSAPNKERLMRVLRDAYYDLTDSYITTCDKYHPDFRAELKVIPHTLSSFDNCLQWGGEYTLIRQQSLTFIIDAMKSFYTKVYSARDYM